MKDSVVEDIFRAVYGGICTRVEAAVEQGLDPSMMNGVEYGEVRKSRFEGERLLDAMTMG